MKYKIINLGCKVNSYESAMMEDLLRSSGYTYGDNSDVVIINTCTVTNTANSKSLKMIRQAVRNNPSSIILVCGCASQIYKENILKIDGVSIVIGNYGKSKIIDYINKYKQEQKQIVDVRDISNISFETMKLINFDKTRAFVKIQDGCNNYCSYCIIPYTRGNVRSRNKEDIIAEVKDLISKGHKEIVLTGIHTGHYGFEFDNYDLSDLIKELTLINGLERLRISSIEITELDDKFLKVLEENSILVSHLHIPLQSGTDSILASMNRKYDTKYFKDKIDKIRKIRPEISITTDVITGFPGETIDDFNATIEFIKTIGFAKIHVFPYSRRSGTKADLFLNQISEEEKKKRTHILLKLSRMLEEKYMEKFIGKNVTMLPEVYDNGHIIGHTDNYLLIKTKGSINDINKFKTCIVQSIEYPYCICN